MLSFIQLFSHTICLCILKARVKITVFTREISKYTLHRYRTTKCKSFLFPNCGWISLFLLAALFICLNFGSDRVWQRSNTSRHTAVLYLCGFIPSLLCLYTVCCQHTIFGSRQESSPAMTQCLSTCAAYVTGKLCALYICISCVFAAETSLFIDITSNHSVGFCFSYLYAQKD